MQKIFSLAEHPIQRADSAACAGTSAVSLPPVDAATRAGQRAEQRVERALGALPAPWQWFAAVEWRLPTRHGESLGEVDVVVFHPHHGAVVLEIKAGAVQVRDGVWLYASGQPMKQSPFTQARRNRFALIDKLSQRLGRGTAEALTVTHGVWFPEVVWRGPLPGAEMTSRACLLDRASLADPEAALLGLLREACPQPAGWTRNQAQVLKELLAPDCQQLVPLVVAVEDAVVQLHQATEAQVAVLRLLRSQPRLLVEGGAGTGKTVLACALARDHAALGKRVLVTCFNKALAQSLAAALQGVPGVDVFHFHDLARTLSQEAGLRYVIPTDLAAQGAFFRDTSPELLLQAADSLGARYDSLVVDEAADFSPTWWVALEALGRPAFSWYCFYDRQQCLFQSGAGWEPPFQAVPLVLEANLRNTRPIGELAAQLGGCAVPAAFRVDEGAPPQVLRSADFAAMATQLKALLRDLLSHQGFKPGQVVVLSPYKHTNAASTWAQGLAATPTTTDMLSPAPGLLRVGTVQGFKGLEADVVVLAGLDAKSAQRPETLYVGASRARAALVVLALDDVPLHTQPLPSQTTPHHPLP